MNQALYRYLALGDSYTIGEAVSATDRWCVQLAHLLQASGVPISEPDIIAQTGWTTANLQEAIGHQAPAPDYDLVTLLIGVNNQYQGLSVRQYAQEFERLLQTATHLAQGRQQRVIVLSIPDWGVTPFANDRDTTQIAAQIDAFNLAAKATAQAMQVHYLDITTLSRAAATDPTLIAPDMLHFSGKLYAQWATIVHPVALSCLGHII